MIDDIDEILKQILVNKVPLEPSEMDIGFGTSERAWAASVSKPLNSYLSDMREHHENRRGMRWQKKY
jgi:hypothetical protein